jgi:hypothetical protein
MTDTTPEMNEQATEETFDSGAVELDSNLPFVLTDQYGDEYTIVIDPAFQALIPPLSETEFATLEANIVERGVLDPVKLWRQEDGTNLLLDGHNRYAIARKHGIINIPSSHLAFADRNEALTWSAHNQMGRRNLNNFMKAELALKMKGPVEAQAKARMSAGAKGEKVDKKMRTRDVLAEWAGVSPRTLSKVDTIIKKAPAHILIAARTGELSVDRAEMATKAFLDAGQDAKSLVTQYEVVDPAAIEAWGVTEKANNKYVREAFARGHVLGLDGSDVPVQQVDATLLRVSNTQEEYESYRRQQQHVDEARKRREEAQAKRDAKAAEAKASGDTQPEDGSDETDSDGDDVQQAPAQTPATPSKGGVWLASQWVTDTVIVCPCCGEKVDITPMLTFAQQGGPDRNDHDDVTDANMAAAAVDPAQYIDPADYFDAADAAKQAVIDAQEQATDEFAAPTLGDNLTAAVSTEASSASGDENMLAYPNRDLRSGMGKPRKSRQ